MTERNRAGGQGQSHGQRGTGHMSQQGAMQRTIELTKECHSVCMKMVVHCLKQGGEHARPEHVRLLIDCAQICATDTDFMLRESDFHRQTCAVCAEVCDACAESCETFRDDQHMQDCARTCRECAEACREMAAG